MSESTQRRKTNANSVQRALLGMLLVEVGLFAWAGTNFLSLANGLEILRLSVEIGLLTLAMTLVIVSGGIDLSVGSLMGLSAVIFGWLWRDMHLPIPLCALLTLALGTLAGGLNGWMVARLRLPPLIVTLGTFSLFRGLAEGFTGGVENYTGWPESFLFLGQGYWLATLPAQIPVLLIALAISYWWLHRAAFGRAYRPLAFPSKGPATRVYASIGA